MIAMRRMNEYSCTASAELVFEMLKAGNRMEMVEGIPHDAVLTHVGVNPDSSIEFIYQTTSNDDCFAVKVHYL